MNQGIIAWIVVSKLCMTLKEQAFKDEDDKDDYLAMHVYPNNDIKGSKLYKAANAIIRSTYRSTQTVMLYLKLPNAQEYIDSNKLLNLVSDYQIWSISELEKPSLKVLGLATMPEQQQDGRLKRLFLKRNCYHTRD